MTTRSKKSHPKIINFSGEHAFLSNFYEWSFEWSGDTWKTGEHAFQAAKAAEPIDYFKIRDCDTPGKAKRLGRHCKLREGWDGVKLDVMESVVKAKFSVPELRDRLLATGNATLIEGNTWGDNYWGADAATLRGENHLGLILMKVRDAFVAEEING
jgi:ribA/ribD-fused uncharacterized protein